METKQRASLFDAVSPYLFRLADLLIVGGAFFAAYYIRFGRLNLNFEYELLVIITAFLCVIFVSMFGVYHSWRGRSRIEMYSRLFLAWSLAFLTVLALLVLSRKGEDFSRLWLGYANLISFSLAVGFRFLSYGALGYLRAKGLNSRNILIIGEKDNVLGIKTHIAAEKWLGFSVKSLLDEKLLSIKDHGPDYSEGLNALERFVKQHQISELWICLPLKKAEFVEEILFALRHSTVDIRYVPDMSGFRLLNHQVSQVAGISTIELSFSPMDGLSYLLKRIEDLVLALGIFLFISPVLVITAIAIKLDSKGPILFKQLRHGADGKPINIYKFRTMKVHQETNGQVSQASKGDDRITKVGAFLRRTSIDEFPQFYNVLQGRMSVVGPRPHAIAHNEHYKEIIESYMQRHKVKPGITGWAQVNGFRGETDTVEKMEKRVEYDLYYIDNWSLFLDIKIVFVSIFKGFVNENAY